MGGYNRKRDKNVMCMFGFDDGDTIKVCTIVDTKMMNISIKDRSVAGEVP